MGVVCEIHLETTRREEAIDITDRVRQVVAQLGGKDMLVCLYVPHSSAAVSIHKEIREGEEATLQDLLQRVDGPAGGTSSAKAALVAPTELLVVKDGQLVMDEDQRIYFYEFDGPKSRRVLVYISG